MSKMHLALLRAEIAAANIAARMATDFRLGRLWRAEAAFAEAVNSVGLEDIRMMEGDLIAKLTTHLTVDHGDPRGVELASSILRLLKAPGDPLSDATAVIRRIEQGVSPLGQSRSIEDVLEEEEFQQIGDAAKAWRGAPIAGALRAAAEYATRSARWSPAAERLIFTAFEGALRAEMMGLRHEHLRDDEKLDPIFAAFRGAHWVVTPSTALTRKGFKIWSPLRADSIMEFCDLVAESLSWEMGLIGQLRHHITKMDEIGDGRRGRSRHADFAQWLPESPIFTSQMVADALGVTRKTALNLIEDFIEAGALRLLTPRHSARLWATSSLADRLIPRTTGISKGWKIQAEKPSVKESVERDYDRDDRGLLPERDNKSLDDALAELDRAMAQADGLLKGMKR